MIKNKISGKSGDKDTNDEKNYFEWLNNNFFIF